MVFSPGGVGHWAPNLHLRLSLLTLTKTSEAHISVEVDSNMAVDAGEFHRALESVCDIFKIPSLYREQEKRLEALF